MTTRKGLSVSIGVCAAVAFLAAILAGCGSKEVAGGGGSGTEIIGMARYAWPDRPMAKASVFISPADSFPDTALVSAPPVPDALTDDNGVFHLRDIAPGEYILDVRDDSGRGYAKRITISQDMRMLSADTLRSWPLWFLSGAISITIPGLPAPTYYVGALGTRRVVRNQPGAWTFFLPDLSAGVWYTVRARFVNPLNGVLDVDSVSASPGDTTSLPPVTIGTP